MSRGKYVVVQGTGFMPYFLCSWNEATNRESRAGWDCLRARALVLDGSAARRIAGLLNAESPAAPVPVTIEVVR